MNHRIRTLVQFSPWLSWIVVSFVGVGILSWQAEWPINLLAPAFLAGALVVGYGVWNDSRHACMVGFGGLAIASFSRAVVLWDFDLSSQGDKVASWVWACVTFGCMMAIHRVAREGVR